MSAGDPRPYEVLAPFYDALSDARDWQAWIDYVNAVLERAAGRRPLRLCDLACGTGRVAVGLQRSGHQVVGVDASAAMLAQADAHMRDTGVTFPLVCQDLRELDLGQTFEGAVSLCDSLNYLVEREAFHQAIARIAAHLEPGAPFLFDVNTEWKLANVYGENTYAEHCETFTYVWENEFDPAERLVEMHLAFFVEQTDGTYRRYDEVHRQRAYSHLEVCAALAGAGFELVGHGDILRLRPPEPQRERVFYLAKKTAAA